MAKREPGVGQVGAKNTKTFFPAARPRPGQRKNKRHYGPCHRPKRKTQKKLKPRHGASWPHTNRPTTHNAARRHTQAIADTQRRENTQALGSHVFVGVRVLRARGCPDAPPQA